MRICTLCKIEQELEEFNFKYKSRDVRQKQCRTCTRKQIKRHYDNNKEYYLKKAMKRNAEYSKIVTEYILKYFESHPCIDCGERDPIVLEFDHVKEKVKEVSKLRRSNSLERVKLEIDKCEVRCANCHRRKTVARWNDKMNKLPL